MENKVKRMKTNENNIREQSLTNLKKNLHEFFCWIRGNVGPKDHGFWSGYPMFAVMVLAVLVSWVAYNSSLTDSRTKLYLFFKNRFHELRIDRPDYRKNGFKEDDAEHEKYFSSYWNLAFDEWYTTNILFPRAGSFLWENYYSLAVKNALSKNKKYYFDSLCFFNKENKLSFISHKNEFLEAIDSLRDEKSKPINQECKSGSNK